MQLPTFPLPEEYDPLSPLPFLDLDELNALTLSEFQSYFEKCNAFIERYIGEGETHCEHLDAYRQRLYKKKEEMEQKHGVTSQGANRVPDAPLRGQTRQEDRPLAQNDPKRRRLTYESVEDGDESEDDE